MNKEVLISMVNSGKIRFIPLRKCFLCNEYIGYKFVRMYNGNTIYETTRNIQERPALYAFKIATEYFRAHGMVPVFENSHCKLMRL